MGRLAILLLFFSASGLAHIIDVEESEHRMKRGAPSTALPRWPRLIPYTISDAFNATQKAIIKQGLDSIMQKTCLKFTEDSSTGPKMQYVLTQGLCSSPVGDTRYQHGPVPRNHNVNLDADCVVKGRIHHETAHALGIHHTQVRADRDDYLIVDEANIRVNYTDNFKKLSVANSPNYGIPFEFGSRMMYPPYDYNIKPTPVLKTRDEGYQSSLGTAPVMTFYDWKFINTHYNCSDSCTGPINCQNGGFQNPYDCSRCICGDFHDGQHCEIERGVITLTENSPEVLTFNTLGDKELVDVPAFDWANFNVDPLRVIKAPKNRRIRVTIEKQFADAERPGHFVQPIIPCPERWCNFFGAEIADEDLTFTGKKFCCSENSIQTTFVSKSNVIGYRAYAHRGYTFQSTVTFKIEPETAPPTTVTSPTTTPSTTPSTTPAPTTTKPTTVPSTTITVPTTKLTTALPTTVAPTTPKPMTTISPTTISPITSTTTSSSIPPRPALPKPEFGEGQCASWNTFSFNEKAGRCLAKSTTICNEQEWEAANAQSYKACKETAPVFTPDVRDDCGGIGKVYERVPGEAVDALYGRRCADNFCTAGLIGGAACVQEQTKAHCCVLPRYA